MADGGRTLAIASALLGVGRRAVGLLPGAVKKNLEDRLFWVIFQRTRIENDAYGWRPPEKRNE